MPSYNGNIYQKQGDHFERISPKVTIAARNPGELVYSLLPLQDSGLHLLDGSVLAGDGIYARFVDYCANLFATQPNSSNVYKVGNLTDIDNVLSGFTTSAYAKLPYAFSPGSSPWEMVFKITTGGDVTTMQNVLSSSTETHDPIQVYISNGKFYLNASSTGTSFDISNATEGTYSIQTNTEYHIKITFSGSSYVVGYSLNGTSYTTDITVSSSQAIKSGNIFLLGVDFTGGIATGPYLNSIDLSGSYININGSRWWSGTHKAGFMDEAEWQATVSKYKACGCFVYDEVANTLRLPKVTGFLEGTVDSSALGTLVEAGVPGITGSVTGFMGNSTPQSSGSLEKILSGERWGVPTTTDTWGAWNTISIDASRSSAVYGNSDTVQPQAIKGFVYMVVSNRTKTQIVADIDQITADLQLKADVDLGNVTAPGNVRMAHAAMPSGQYIELSVPANAGSVTAPAEGYIYFYALSNGSGSGITLTGKYGVSSISNSSGQALNVTLNVSKEDIVYVGYYASSNMSLKFIYSNGSAS